MNIKDNKGLSLLEFIVALGIAAMVMTVLLAISSTSIFQYRSISIDTNLQNEAQLTSNQIRDVLMDVNRAITWTEEDDENVLTVYYIENENTANEKKMIGVLKYEKDNNTLLYSLYEYEDDITDLKEYVVSNKIKDFACDVSKIDDEGLIEFDITYIIDDEEWADQSKFAFRNEVYKVDSVDEIYGE